MENNKCPLPGIDVLNTGYGDFELRFDPNKPNEEVNYALCALCLHPIGYYADTWAGVMCPTDEVIAHLVLMRGSEEKFWANANQHPLDRPAAGL
jgi:hypothetical protein